MAVSGTAAHGCVSRVSPVQTAPRNCTRDEGGPFGFGDQELIPSYRKLLWSKAMVVSRMMREYHVRFCEGLGVKFPG